MRSTGPITMGHNELKGEDGEYTVYTIKVQSEETGKELLYVGRTKNFESRMKSHSRNSNTISHFTQENGQIRAQYDLLEIVETESFDDIDAAQYKEREVMVELSAKKGIENVAGGI